MGRFIEVITRVSCCLLLIVGGNTMSAESSDTIYDQYTLQASAEGDVVNDLMVVHLRVEHEDRDAKALAERVNQEMAWALEQLEAFERIDTKTQNYNTSPKYEQNRVVGWRSSQTLEIQGSDFEQIKEALQKLQSKLQIQHMQFLPRDETRKQIEDNLIREALDNFKHRAAIVQENMGAKTFRVMQININTGGRNPARMRMQHTQAAGMSRSLESAPAVEGGESKISVSISGQIQLQ